MKKIDDSDGLFKERPGSISTFTGRMDPLDPIADEINIADIAHALSRQCRYNGHCAGFLSVARHCIWVMDYLAGEGHGASIQLAGLLHDAAEAYVGDMVRPLKLTPEMKAFRDADQKVDAVIAEKFGIPHPMCEPVAEADRYVLVEMELPDLRYTWFGSYEDDEKMFLYHYERLTNEVRACA